MISNTLPIDRSTNERLFRDRVICGLSDSIWQSTMAGLIRKIANSLNHSTVVDQSISQSVNQSIDNPSPSSPV
jgi:hypothetical protein